MDVNFQLYTSYYSTIFRYWADMKKTPFGSSLTVGEAEESTNS